MKQIKKILCPVDFSEYSNEALHYALQLAESNKSQVYIIHVLPQINYYDWYSAGMYALISEDTYTQVKKETDEKMNELITDVKSKHPSLTITFKVDETNNATDGILNAANEFETDLIVIGSHGRKGFNRLLMGSIAESVMRHADTAVIIYKKEKTAII